MCDCPKDKAASSRNDDAYETSPQTQSEGPPSRRPEHGCCRRVLTYEDEANVTVTELPISIPPLPAIAGVAIVRRRIDFGTSPDHKDEVSRKADDNTTSEDLEKQGEGESSAAETQNEEDKNIVTSTPSPGQLNANNNCNCSPVPKT